MIKIANCTRNSQYGDIIASLPFLNYLEKCWPGSYKMAYIDKKCYQIAQFLLNHSLIDRVQISSESDLVNDFDRQIFSFYDYAFDPFPPITENEYYNKMHITEQLFRMNRSYWNSQNVPVSGWNQLTNEEKKPKLNQYFDIKRQPKTIAVWPFSGYKKDNSISIDLRSPSKQWWLNLCEELHLNGYTILQFGHPFSEQLDNEYGIVKDLRNLSLFEAIKMSLGCDLVVGTDSGSQWIIGAYGYPQICLYTNYQRNHYQNFDAMVPINYKNNLISIRGIDTINSIKQEEVLEAIKKFN